MFTRRSTLTVLGAAILGVALTAPVAAELTVKHTNYLTFRTAFALPGVSLTPGTYTFERADENMDPSVVRVLSRDRSKVYLMAFTRRISRPAGMRPDQAVSFGEAPAGAPPPISAWFPVGESTGHQFVYPSHRD